MNREQRGGSAALLSNQIGEEGELIRPSSVRSLSEKTPICSTGRRRFERRVRALDAARAEDAAPKAPRTPPSEDSAVRCDVVPGALAETRGHSGVARHPP